jgi:hypothetical protein
MSLPEDLYVEILTYLSVRPILNFRVVSKAAVEYAKEYKGGPLRIYSLEKWRACFPRATRANLSGLNVCTNDMKYLANVQDLDMSFCCPYVDMIHRFQLNLTWFHLPGLKKLTLVGTELMTDKWLALFTDLEELSISHSSNSINGSGFRTMTKLKSLTLNSMRPIGDDALKGLPLEDLTIISNSRITDAGIRQLTQLKKLYLCWVKRVKCYGFEDLPLKQLYVSDIDVDHEVFRSLARVPKMGFSQCHFLDGAYGLWTKLTHLNVYESSFEDMDDLAKLMDLPHFVQLTLTRCPESPSLREKMRAKLIELHRE